MGPIQSLSELFDLVRRRFPVMIAVIILGCGLSVVYALQKQHMYRSAEVIQVAQPKIADDLARSTVDGTAAQRLQLIQQRLMTRAVLLEVIAKYGLYADLPALTQAELTDRLRHAVRIEGVASAGQGSGGGAVSVLTITAEMPSPQQAQQVAHEFAERTIALSRSTRIEQARETLDFFTAREEALSAEIAKVEDALAQFRLENDLSLPGSVEFRRDEIATINEGLLSIARERIQIERAADQARRTERPATAERMLADFNEQLATLDAQRDLLQGYKAELEASIETSPAIDRQIGAFERQLAQMRAELERIATSRTEAEVGFRLETQSQSERLTVIEPAQAPDYPFTGSRKKLAMMGALISMGAAFLVAFLLDLRNPVLRTSTQMERELGIKPVVSVPHLDTRPGRRSRRARNRDMDRAAET